ncbi:MAG: hypothetical protein Kow0013_22800 [Pararhodobacter sp.]
MFAIAHRGGFPRPLTLSAAALCLMTTSALAQEMSAKDAWQDLRIRARESGLLIASQGATDYGTALVATDVRVTSQDNPEAGVLTIPELRIEVRDGERVTLIPSPELTLTLHPSQRIEREFTLRHDGEVSYLVTDDTAEFDLGAETLEVELTRALNRGEPADTAFAMTLLGFRATLDALREGTLEAVASAESVDYSFVMADDSARRPARQSGTARIEDLHIELAGSELDTLPNEPGMLGRAFDAGFALRLALSSGASIGSSEQSFGNAPIALNSEAAQSDLLLDVSDGALLLETSVTDARFSGGMGPMQGDLGVARMALSIGAPLIRTTDDRIAHYNLDLTGITASEATLALIGAQDFAGETASLALGVSADMRLLEDLGPEFGQGDEPPLDLSQARLDRLELSLGDARLTGNGAFAFLGGLMASIDNDLPQGTGDFVFELVGGDALLTRLSAAGLVPADQQFFARMMMNGLGRPVGEDHLRSEVAIRPGGAITVNGAPLPF